jgi:hypothetical protein
MANFQIKDKNFISSLSTGDVVLIQRFSDNTTLKVPWSLISGSINKQQLFYGSGNPSGILTVNPPAIYYDRNPNSLTYLTVWYNTGDSTNNTYWV